MSSVGWKNERKHLVRETDDVSNIYIYFKLVKRQVIISDLVCVKMGRMSLIMEQHSPI